MTTTRWRCHHDVNQVPKRGPEYTSGGGGGGANAGEGSSESKSAKTISAAVTR